MVTVRKGSKKKSGKMTSGGKCMWWESGRRFMLPVEANLRGIMLFMFLCLSLPLDLNSQIDINDVSSKS